MIDVTVFHRQIIEGILQKRVPDCEVRAFGSRVLGTAKSYSDLDLVVMGSEKLPRTVLYGLRDDFEECDLPYRVDLLDWNRLSPEFKHVILAHSEVLR
jgi:predicted nucleotidyltransferase